MKSFKSIIIAKHSYAVSTEINDADLVLGILLVITVRKGSQEVELRKHSRYN